MAEPSMPETSALAKRSEGSSLRRSERQSRKDGALEAALERLAPNRTLERPDTPDLHVTAVRRLPAVAAQHAPFPASLDPRLTAALVSRGVDQLYTHQGEAI